MYACTQHLRCSGLSDNLTTTVLSYFYDIMDNGLCVYMCFVDNHYYLISSEGLNHYANAVEAHCHVAE